MEKRNVMQQQLERKLVFIRAGRPKEIDIPAAREEGNEMVHEVNEQNAARLGFAFYRIEVPDVQTLKSLAGRPDELIEEGLLEDMMPAPKQMDAEREKELLRSDRDIFLGETCEAFRTYIYGHSDKAKSYERIINILRFPETVDVFEIKDLHLKKGEVWEFGREDPEKQISVLVDKLTMEEGAEIRVYCFADFNVTEAVFQKNTKICSCGIDGRDGSTPATGGADGLTGEKGEDSKSGTKTCELNAGKGGTGGIGQPGLHGGNGGNGRGGSTLTWTFSNAEGEFPQICSCGGNGGKGGNGTDGGNGGNGGPGGNPSKHCSTGAQGDGGDGGIGGDGGNGGDGGDGGDIFLTICLKEGQKAFDIDTVYAGGNGGAGGIGGIGGNGGIGLKSGKKGVPGRAGECGACGRRGKINIVQTIVKKIYDVS